MNRRTGILLFYIISFSIRLAFSSLVPLIDDEAYHWSWTQNLSLSYFDHPGMIAWMEFLSTKLFGLTYFAVRLPSFICYAATVWVSFKLATQMFRNSWAGHFVAFMLLWTPFWGFGGYVASPETPFMLCWILATYVFWQSTREQGPQWSAKKTWLLLGLIMGAGINSKFIIALLALGFAVYMLTNSKQRKTLLTPWPWIGLIISVALAYPIFRWNTQFDWPSFKYQFHDRHSDGEFSLQKYFGFLASQIMLLSPAGYFLAVIVFIFGAQQWYRQLFNVQMKSPNHSKLNEFCFLFCLSLPSIAIFYTQALFSDFKPHWSGAAYLLLSVGAGGVWSTGLTSNSSPSNWYIQPMSRKVVIWLMAFFIPLNLLIYSPFLGPWMPKFYRTLNLSTPWESKWDLSNEFYGWEDLGQHLLMRQKQIEMQTGKAPFLAAHRYETTAQTYWGSKQRVYTLNTTRSHYTVTTTKDEMKSLLGRDALFVHSDKYTVNPNEWIRWDICDRELFNTFRGLEISHTFTIYYCKNFQGLK